MTKAPSGWADRNVPNKPASGIPAGGEGWGGPAKGDRPRGPKTDFNGSGPGGIENVGFNARKRAEEAVRAEEMKTILYTLASSAEREETKVRAAEAYLNRTEGMPVARQVNYYGGEAKHIISDRPMTEEEWAKSVANDDADAA